MPTHLLVVFQAEVAIPGIAAKAGALFHRHVAGPRHLAGESAAVGRLGVAAAVRVRGRNRGRGLAGGTDVHVKPVAGAAVLSGIAGAGEGALGQLGLGAPGAESVAAVALAAVLYAKVLEARAGSSALLDCHLVVEIVGAGKSPRTGGFGVASRKIVAGDLGHRTAPQRRNRVRRAIDA